jgi:hypothetical protein
MHPKCHPRAKYLRSLATIVASIETHPTPELEEIARAIVAAELTKIEAEDRTREEGK